MCLASLADFSPCRKGYQVKTKRDGNYYSVYFGIDISQKRDEWIDADEVSPLSNYILTVDSETLGYRRYISGFHVFHRKVDAVKYLSADKWLDSRKCCVVKVAVRQPLVTGYQRFEIDKGHPSSAKVTVAKKIKILEEVK